MKKTALLILFLISTLVSLSQPANDNCSGAQNLGNLPTPVACPNGTGANVNVSGTTINATSPSPYTYLLSCQTGGNQPAPAVDVWYRFVATGTQVNINITPGTAPVLQNPAISLWQGTNCGSLTGVNCDNNGTAAGNNTATFQPLTPGQTYYIQISETSTTGTGNFNMSVNNSNDCNNCLQTSNLTATPAPINGTYQPGQTVTFCYTITSFTQVSANWLHGIIPTFGNGWNLASLTTTPAASCSGSGTWIWYNSNTSSATGLTTGPGFYYNYTTGAAGAGNNFGDNNLSGNCTWTFCWTMQTKANCGSGTNLNISINTTADGETGSWTSPACGGDPNYTFGAILNCCSTTVIGTPPTCFNGTNGTATATPTGIAPYTYSWNTSPVQTTQTATNLSPGNYTVTVTDNAGCVSTATVNIPNPAQILAPITSTNVSCNGVNNGQATVNPSGGVAPYTYSWNTTPVQTTQTANGLSAGNYTVTVTASNGCIRTNTITITQPPILAATTTVVPSNCGQPNGSATANITSGTGPFTYSWNTTPIQTTQTATNLLPGSYTVTITGLNGCTTTAVALITTTGSITAQATSTNVSCFGGNNGTATATGTGGTSYTYSWNTVPVQTTQTATNLGVGTYTVTVTSAGCSATATVSITQPNQLTATATSTNITCNGLNNGTANVSVSGGVGPYTYSWNTVPVQTTPSISNLSPGSYTVTVSDANGCQTTATVSITQPNTLSVNITSTAISCNGGNNGTATATPSGGTGPYTYSWNTTPVQTTQTATGLPSGTYTVTITDFLGCVTTSTITLTNPPPIVVGPISHN